MEFEGLIDQAAVVRAGEELDETAVDAFVKARVPGIEWRPTITQFPGGASNLTYLGRYPQRELILRRPPFGHRGILDLSINHDHYLYGLFTSSLEDSSPY